VRYDEFGDIDVLHVDEVERPRPGAGEVLVGVRAAGINPVEETIRKGVFAERWPSTFPSGQGSDLAGVVEEVGEGVEAWAAGDEVIGFVEDRSSQAELVLVPADQLLRKPAGVSWEQAGALHVAGATAWAATCAVDPQPGEVLVVSGAAGGVGSLVVQLGVERGARVIGLAGPDNHAWLAEHGVEPIAYGDGVEERIRAAAPSGVDAFIDTYGSGYVDLAISLGVAPERINTIIDWAAAEKYGAKVDGNLAGANVPDLTEVAARIADGRVEIPIAATYPLEQVGDAYRQLEQRHTRGKIVLVP
jgi:NADPH:quinone reductase-like Zn-dependent oxidoreductase